MKILDAYRKKNQGLFVLHDVLPVYYESYAKNLLKNASEHEINEIKNLNKTEAWYLSAEEFELWQAYKLIYNEDI